MMKLLFKAVATLALAVSGATAAHAVTFFSNYNFSFNSSWVVSSSTGVGNSITFRSTTDPLLRVKATAWSIDRGTTASNTDDIVTAATLRFWSGGLGVQNIYEANTSPNHSIDNGVDSTTVNGNTVAKNMVDFVLLQFNYDVDINTMGTGWVSGDSDASLRVGAGPTSNPANWANTPALNNRPVIGNTTGVELSDFVQVNTTAAGMNPTANGTPSTRNVNGDNQDGMIWLIGALYGTESNDFFKLNALGVTVFPTIPEPSTWMTLILGFGFIGWSMRRAASRASTTVLGAA
ncbi:PEPxxWA-CTERM sorting domain-containing protein [Novosphingobium piscinae]|uniref:PEP-CTERM sorting domain-containing protein n=1 Tax=Novosphingobium piscinae TaxID=1507448 RepID=A0A7X1FW95_9SPHN|nr:PEPxxWA-CTERM sorting domain-containing protein [Novosphingobium piscinae]MBC2668153.1 PEP-CTERM sorting domain-containing protein [Novosphingobium piscinae]